MKKLFSLCLTVLMLAMLVSCSNEKSSPTSQTAGNNSVVNPSSEEEISVESKLSASLSKVSQTVNEITDPNDDPIIRAKECYRWLYHNFKYRAVEIDLSKGYTDELISELADYYFLYHKGSCEHYAVMTLLMLKGLGFETQLVEGERYDASIGEWGEHVWVIVKIYDKYYHVDGLFGGNHTPDLYSMFCVCDDAVADTHKWDKGKYPACSENLYLK